MKKIVLVLIFAISLFANENYKISTEIEVSGLVENNIKLDVKELEKMSYFKSGSTPVVCMSGETKDNVESYEGVLLRDIVEKAILNNTQHKSNYEKHHCTCHSLRILRIPSSRVLSGVFSQNKRGSSKNSLAKKECHRKCLYWNRQNRYWSRG